MRGTFARLGVLLLTLAGATAADAQTKSVTANLTTGTITGAAPFDEPFRITGDADPAVQSISLEYGILKGNPCKAKASSADATPTEPKPLCDISDSPFKDGKSRKAVPWRRSSSTANTFSFVVGELEPGQCYGFRFRQLIAPPTEADRTAFRTELAKRLQAALTEAFKNGVLDTVHRQQVEASLNTTAARFVRDRLNACIAPDLIKLTGEPLETIANSILGAKANIPSEADVTLKRDAVARGLCLRACNPRTETWAKGLAGQLNALLADATTLTPGAQKTWEGKLNPAHGAQTMAEVARAVANGLPPGMQLMGLLKGELKLAGSAYDPVVAIDVPSLQLLHDFLTVYTSEAFRRKSRNGTEPVVDPVLVRDDLKPQVVDKIEELILILQKDSIERGIIAAATFPDLLADVVLSRPAEATVTPTVVVEGKNPYISADVGFGYAGRFNKAFLYYGANFYTAPVNKDVDYPAFSKGGLRKRFSFLAGLTSSGPDGDNITALFGPGNVMVGAGWRFNKYVKVNAGGVFFKQKDANPLIDKQRVKGAPFGSLSIDMDLKQLLSGFGKIFGS